jgi:hypothetical protein
LGDVIRERFRLVSTASRMPPSYKVDRLLTQLASPSNLENLPAVVLPASQTIRLDRRCAMK